MHIAVIIAGTNDPSNSHLLSQYFLEGIRAAEPQTQVSTMRLKDLPIEHFTLKYYDPVACKEDNFHALALKVMAADGIVIASPIWNFSVPAHLKNFIDRLGAYALDHETHSRGQMKNKPVAFLYTGGAPMIAWKALMHITTVHMSEAIKYYGGSVALKHFEPKCLRGRGQFGLVVDRRPNLRDRMRRSGGRFARIVRIYTDTGRLPMWLNCKTQFSTWAYRIGNRIMYPLSRGQ